MRKLITVPFILFCVVWSAIPLRGQVKVLEKSSRKTPVWVNGAEQEYIIASAIASDLEMAKEECMDHVRKEIIRSVAENLDISRGRGYEQRVENREVVDFVEYFTSHSESQSASIPFISGISASKIEDAYWEKRQDKATKKITYLYAVKYPVPSLQLKKWVRDFEERDREMYDRYLALADHLDRVRTVEEIGSAINDLDPLIDYFFDRVRKTEAKTLQSKYRQLYDAVTIRPVSNELGRYRFALMLGGNEITSSKLPRLSSTVATRLETVQDGTQYEVTYDYSGAVYDEENSVSIRFPIANKFLNHTFYFTVEKHAVEIFPEGTAYLTAEVKSPTVLSDIEIRIDFKTVYKEFVVRNMTLNIPGFTDPLFLDRLDRTVAGPHATLEVFYVKEVEIGKTLDGRFNLLTGQMDVFIPEKNKEERFCFALTFKPNW